MTITAAIYNTETGQILKWVTCPASMLDAQVGLQQEFFLNCERWATHIIDGVPVTVANTIDRQMEIVRKERNHLLRDSDWTQLADVSLSTDEQALWRTYRQALRDFPATCDPYAPTWPTPPQ